MGTSPVERGPADEVKHVLGLAREQDGEQTEHNAPHRDDDGCHSKMPGQGCQFGLALHDTVQMDMRGIEEGVQSVVP